MSPHGSRKPYAFVWRNLAGFPKKGLGGFLSGVNKTLTGGDIAISLVGTDREVDDAMTAIASFRDKLS